LILNLMRFMGGEKR